jgi:HK97 family phage portal protein
VAFWRTIGRYLSGAGNRQVGLQTGQPSNTTQSATPVTVDSALSLSAVWACTRMISEAIGALPIRIWDVDPKTGVKTPNTTHPLYALFNGKMNRWQTRQEFFETYTFQLVLMGNAYAAIQRNGKKIVGLIPLMSEQMEVSLDDSGTRLFRYSESTSQKFYAEETIWHSKLFGNAIIGLSPLGYARNSIGIGQAAEKSVTKIYQNGGKPSGILTIDKVLTDVQRAAIKANFSELAEGNNDRLFVLEAGMKYEQVSLSPQDIELLASRRFQIEDIARFFGVPSVLINDTAAGTTWGSGIQQIVQGFYKLNLKPFLERYEASMKCWLLTPEERLTMDIEFDFNSLLQPELKDRITSGKEAVQGGLYTPNEWRMTEGMQPKDGGDKLLVQQQMIPIDKAGTMQAQQNNADLSSKIDALANRRDQQTFNLTMPEIKMQAAKSPDITVNVPERSVNVSTPAVMVNVPEPVVNVSAPNVKVESPTVNVAAPNVDIKNEIPEIKVNLPKRVSKTKVKYDKSGNISETEQTEEDA